MTLDQRSFHPSLRFPTSCLETDHILLQVGAGMKRLRETQEKGGFKSLSLERKCLSKGVKQRYTISPSAESPPKRR